MTYGSVVSRLMTVFIRQMMAAVGAGELVVKLQCRRWQRQSGVDVPPDDDPFRQTRKDRGNGYRPILGGFEAAECSF